MCTAYSHIVKRSFLSNIRSDEFTTSSEFKSEAIKFLFCKVIILHKNFFIRTKSIISISSLPFTSPFSNSKAGSLTKTVNVSVTPFEETPVTVIVLQRQED